MRKPRIGITMRLDLESRRFYLGKDYSEALNGLGSIPVHLALIPDEDYVSQCLAGLDGVLLPGSDTDVDPVHYGEEPHPRLKRVVESKDETDRLVIQMAERHNLPLLGICYGMQALNVTRGGSLIQDIESSLESPLKHEQGIPLERTSHSITIEEDSRLAKIVGGLSVRVNSHHHQSVKRPGTNLRITARAFDGVVECIEDVNPDIFVMGVQWHPELAWRDNPVSQAIFSEFIEASAKH